jgi:hypothetical protein
MGSFDQVIRRCSPLSFLRQEGSSYGSYSKQPICETTAERVVISLLYSEKKYLKKLKAEDIDENSFFLPEHKLIFSEITRLIGEDQPVSYERLLPWAEHNRIDRDVINQALQAGYSPHLLDDAIQSLKNAQLKRLENELVERINQTCQNGQICESDIGRLAEIVKGGHPDWRRLPPVKSALEIFKSPPQEGEGLIGDRFLCRGGGMVIFGPSGVGKSTFTAGLCVAFARGEAYLQIRPSGPLKILVIQAENDDGDLHEQLQGAIGELMEGDKISLAERLRFATVDHLSGSDFLTNAVSRYLDKERPDLLVIDCLSAYLGDSPTEPKALIGFLRNGLTKLLRQFNCGCVVVHHTSKTTNQNSEVWKASDMQYAMAGGADLANWMRSGLFIKATDLPDVFMLHVTKRMGRLGWRNAEGEASSTMLIRHSKRAKEGTLSLRWEIADHEDIERLTKATVKPSGTQRRIPDDEEVLALFPQVCEGDNPEDWLMTTDDLKLKFKERGFSKNDVAPIMKNLVKAGKLALILKPRNAKCYALPAIAAEYQTATSANPAGA